MLDDIDRPAASCDTRDPAGEGGPRVFVLSDFRLLREGLVHALAQQTALRVVGSAGFAMRPQDIAGFRPDALLVDATDPGALAIVRPARAQMPDIKIIALGVPEADQAIMACARAGVTAFVEPDASARDVAAALQSAARGELVCSPRAAGLLLTQFGAMAAARPGDPDIASPGEEERLTEREQEIAVLISQGMANKQVARLLGIQNATVKNHVHSILGKLRLRRRGEVALQILRGRAASATKTAPFSTAAAACRGDGRRRAWTE